MFYVHLVAGLALVLESANAKVTSSTRGYKILKSLKAFLLAQFLAETLRRFVNHTRRGIKSMLFSFLFHLRRGLMRMRLVMHTLLFFHDLFESLAVLVYLLSVRSWISLWRDFVRNQTRRSKHFYSLLAGIHDMGLLLVYSTNQLEVRVMRHVLRYFLVAYQHTL